MSTDPFSDADELLRALRQLASSGSLSGFMTDIEALARHLAQRAPDISHDVFEAWEGLEEVRALLLADAETGRTTLDPLVAIELVARQIASVAAHALRQSASAE
jgi:hypothetical protein